MREDNISMLQNTLEILERGSYPYQGRTVPLKLTSAQMTEVQVYLPEEVRRICRSKDFSHVQKTGRCGYSCENIDSFTLARRRAGQYADERMNGDAKPVLVLNLANPVNPGGGVRMGAKAQEEDLCRKSSLLLSLESPEAKAYYGYNQALHTYMGSDALMIHPQVEILKDEKGNLLPETVVVAVMTCAAPMLLRGMEGLTREQYERLLYGRITGMLKVAAFLGYRDLILGAFGCGAFGNDAKIVSDLFYKALKEFDYDGMRERDLFRRIDFAVLCRPGATYNYDEFSRNFAHFYRDEDQKIQNIVFDIGGVLADFRLKAFLAEKGFDDAMSRRIIKAAVMSPYWGMFERGELTEEETLQGFARADPGIREELYRAFSNLEGMLRIREYAVPLVRALKQAGYGVHYLSNYSKKAYEECGESLAFMSWMDGGLVSFKAGRTKPSPEMYAQFLREFGLKAETCVFVDDTAENVEAARALGFIGIEFSDYDGLIKELKALGIRGLESPGTEKEP